MTFTHFLNEAPKATETTVQPKTKDELKKIIEDTIKEQGFNCDLNFIDTSLIRDMSYMFARTKFNGDISKWNVSRVEDMVDMFNRSPLEGNEPDWYKD